MPSTKKRKDIIPIPHIACWLLQCYAHPGQHPPLSFALRVITGNVHAYREVVQAVVPNLEVVA